MNRALFLDRDGVINIEKEYLYKIEDFEFIDGIFSLCKYFQEQNYKIIVVTNQSGIARGYYSRDDLHRLTEWMRQAFLKEGIAIDDLYFCPHYPSVSGECSCRKPKPGMLLEAASKHNIDLSHSIIVGDKERDIEAGLNAGLNECYLFDEDGTVTMSKATRIVRSLNEIWS